MPTSRKPHSHQRASPTARKEEAKSRTIPVVEEEVSVSRKVEKTGELRVRIASSGEKQQIPVTEVIEEVSVERVPVNQYVDERTGPREEGDVVVIPVFETVPVVEQRLLLKEEVRIVRHRHEVQREEETVLRKDTPIVERRASSQEEWSQDTPET